MSRKLTGAAAVVAALIGASMAVSATPAVVGKQCPKVGATSKSAAKKPLVCAKVGTHLRWKLAKPAKAAPAPPQTTKVTGSAFEMAFKLSQTVVPHGTVIFTITNTGQLPHDFSFGSAGGGTTLLDAGQSATLTVQFAKPGKYTYICTVEGHQEAGMIGSLTVT